MKNYPSIKCKSCRYKGQLPQFVSGMGSILVCPKCGNNFYPPILRGRKRTIK